MSTPPIVNIKAQYLQEEAHIICLQPGDPEIKERAGRRKLFLLL
jgi:hypothetical protein